MPHERNEEMRDYIEAWKVSRLSQTDYCQHNNIKPHIFVVVKNYSIKTYPLILQNEAIINSFSLYYPLFLPPNLHPTTALVLLGISLI